MALLTMHYFSYQLNMSTEVQIVIPDNKNSCPTLEAKRYPVLYLLHGHSDDSLAWLRHTNIEDLAYQYGYIVVMPTTHRGYYSDAKHGLRYFSYIAKELISAIDNTFPTIPDRNNRVIAGLSMGGYGAAKIALKRPDLFSAFASFSGALDPFATRCFKEQSEEMLEEKMQNLENIFGPKEEFYSSDCNLKVLFKNYLENSNYPIRFYLSCGTEDPLYPCNKEYEKYLNSIGMDIKLVEKSGTHNWEFWSEEIKNAFRFFTD